MGETYLVTGGRDTVIYVDGLQTREFTYVSSVAEPERPGDVKHSCVDISVTRNLLDYEPRPAFVEGVGGTVEAVADRRAGWLAPETRT